MNTLLTTTRGALIALFSVLFIVAACGGGGGIPSAVVNINVPPNLCGEDPFAVACLDAGTTARTKEINDCRTTLESGVGDCKPIIPRIAITCLLNPFDTKCNVDVYDIVVRTRLADGDTIPDLRTSRIDDCRTWLTGTTFDKLCGGAVLNECGTVANAKDATLFTDDFCNQAEYNSNRGVILANCNTALEAGNTCAAGLLPPAVINCLSDFVDCTNGALTGDDGAFAIAGTTLVELQSARKLYCTQNLADIDKPLCSNFAKNECDPFASATDSNRMGLLTNPLCLGAQFGDARIELLRDCNDRDTQNQAGCTSDIIVCSANPFASACDSSVYAGRRADECSDPLVASRNTRCASENIVATYCGANLFSRFAGCDASSYDGARLNHCTDGANSNGSNCKNTSVFTTAQLACFTNPFGAGCDTALDDGDEQTPTAQGNRLAYCRGLTAGTVAGNDLCDGAVADVCTGDAFDAFCFADDTYVGMRETQCSATGVTGLDCTATIASICANNPFAQTVGGTSTNLCTGGDDTRADLIARCSDADNSNNAGCDNTVAMSATVADCVADPYREGCSDPLFSTARDARNIFCATGGNADNTAQCGNAIAANPCIGNPFGNGCDADYETERNARYDYCEGDAPIVGLCAAVVAEICVADVSGEVARADPFAAICTLSEVASLETVRANFCDAAGQNRTAEVRDCMALVRSNCDDNPFKTVCFGKDDQHKSTTFAPARAALIKRCKDDDTDTVACNTIVNAVTVGICIKDLFTAGCGVGFEALRVEHCSDTATAFSTNCDERAEATLTRTAFIEICRANDQASGCDGFANGATGGTIADCAANPFNRSNDCNNNPIFRSERDARRTLCRAAVTLFDSLCDNLDPTEGLNVEDARITLAETCVNNPQTEGCDSFIDGKDGLTVAQCSANPSNADNNCDTDVAFNSVRSTRTSLCRASAQRFAPLCDGYVDLSASVDIPASRLNYCSNGAGSFDVNCQKEYASESAVGRRAFVALCSATPTTTGCSSSVVADGVTVADCIENPYRRACYGSENERNLDFIDEVAARDALCASPTTFFNSLCDGGIFSLLDVDAARLAHCRALTTTFDANCNEADYDGTDDARQMIVLACRGATVDAPVEGCEQVVATVSENQQDVDRRVNHCIDITGGDPYQTGCRSELFELDRDSRLELCTQGANASNSALCGNAVLIYPCISDPFPVADSCASNFNLVNAQIARRNYCKDEVKTSSDALCNNSLIQEICDGEQPDDNPFSRLCGDPAVVTPAQRTFCALEGLSASNSFCSANEAEICPNNPFEPSFGVQRLVCNSANYAVYRIKQCSDGTQNDATLCNTTEIAPTVCAGTGANANPFAVFCAESLVNAGLADTDALDAEKLKFADACAGANTEGYSCNLAQATFCVADGTYARPFATTCNDENLDVNIADIRVTFCGTGNNVDANTTACNNHVGGTCATNPFANSCDADAASSVVELRTLRAAYCNSFGTAMLALADTLCTSDTAEAVCKDGYGDVVGNPFDLICGLDATYNTERTTACLEDTTGNLETTRCPGLVMNFCNDSTASDGTNPFNSKCSSGDYDVARQNACKADLAVEGGNGCTTEIAAVCGTALNPTITSNNVDNNLCSGGDLKVARGEACAGIADATIREDKCGAEDGTGDLNAYCQTDIGRQNAPICPIENGKFADSNCRNINPFASRCDGNLDYIAARSSRCVSSRLAQNPVALPNNITDSDCVSAEELICGGGTSGALTVTGNLFDPICGVSYEQAQAEACGPTADISVNSECPTIVRSFCGINGNEFSTACTEDSVAQGYRDSKCLATATDEVGSGNDCSDAYVRICKADPFSTKTDGVNASICGTAYNDDRETACREGGKAFGTGDCTNTITRICDANMENKIFSTVCRDVMNITTRRTEACKTAYVAPCASHTQFTEFCRATPLASATKMQCEGLGATNDQYITNFCGDVNNSANAFETGCNDADYTGTDTTYDLQLDKACAEGGLAVHAECTNKTRAGRHCLLDAYAGTGCSELDGIEGIRTDYCTENRSDDTHQDYDAECSNDIESICTGSPFDGRCVDESGSTYADSRKGRADACRDPSQRTGLDCSAVDTCNTRPYSTTSAGFTPDNGTALTCATDPAFDDAKTELIGRCALGDKALTDEECTNAIADGASCLTDPYGTGCETQLLNAGNVTIAKNGRNAYCITDGANSSLCSSSALDVVCTATASPFATLCVAAGAGLRYLDERVEYCEDSAQTFYTICDEFVTEPGVGAARGAFCALNGNTVNKGNGDETIDGGILFNETLCGGLPLATTARANVCKVAENAFLTKCDVVQSEADVIAARARVCVANTPNVIRGGEDTSDILFNTLCNGLAGVTIARANVCKVAENAFLTKCDVVADDADVIAARAGVCVANTPNVIRGGEDTSDILFNTLCNGLAGVTTARTSACLMSDANRDCTGFFGDGFTAWAGVTDDGKTIVNAGGAAAGNVDANFIRVQIKTDGTLNLGEGITPANQTILTLNDTGLSSDTNSGFALASANFGDDGGQDNINLYVGLLHTTTDLGGVASLDTTATATWHGSLAILQQNDDSTLASYNSDFALTVDFDNNSLRGEVLNAGNVVGVDFALGNNVRFDRTSGLISGDVTLSKTTRDSDSSAVYSAARSDEIYPTNTKTTATTTATLRGIIGTEGAVATFAGNGNGDTEFGDIVGGFAVSSTAVNDACLNVDPFADGCSTNIPQILTAQLTACTIGKLPNDVVSPSLRNNCNSLETVLCANNTDAGSRANPWAWICNQLVVAPTVARSAINAHCGVTGTGLDAAVTANENKSVCRTRALVFAQARYAADVAIFDANRQCVMTDLPVLFGPLCVDGRFNGRRGQYCHDFANAFDTTYCIVSGVVATGVDINTVQNNQTRICRFPNTSGYPTIQSSDCNAQHIKDALCGANFTNLSNPFHATCAGYASIETTRSDFADACVNDNNSITDTDADCTTGNFALCITNPFATDASVPNKEHTGTQTCASSPAFSRIQGEILESCRGGGITYSNNCGHASTYTCASFVTARSPDLFIDPICRVNTDYDTARRDILTDCGTTGDCDTFRVRHPDDTNSDYLTTDGRLVDCQDPALAVLAGCEKTLNRPTTAAVLEAFDRTGAKVSTEGDSSKQQLLDTPSGGVGNEFLIGQLDTAGYLNTSSYVGRDGATPSVVYSVSIEFSDGRHTDARPSSRIAGVAYFAGRASADAVGTEVRYFAGLLPYTDFGVALPTLPQAANVDVTADWTGHFGWVVYDAADDAGYTAGTDTGFTLTVNFTARTISGTATRTSDSLAFVVSGAYDDKGLIDGGITIGQARYTGQLIGAIGEFGAAGAFHASGTGLGGAAGGFAVYSNNGGKFVDPTPSVPTIPASGGVGTYGLWAFDIQTRDSVIQQLIGGTGLLQSLQSTGALSNEALGVGGGIRAGGGVDTTTPFRLSLDGTFLGGDVSDGVAYFTGTRGGLNNYHAGLFATTDVGALLPTPAGIVLKWTGGSIGYVVGVGDTTLTHHTGTFTLSLNLDARTFAAESFAGITGIAVSGSWNAANGLIADTSRISFNDGASTFTLTGLIGEQGAIGAFVGSSGTTHYAGGFVANAPMRTATPDPALLTMPSASDAKGTYARWAFDIQTRDSVIKEEAGGFGYLRGLTKGGALTSATLGADRLGLDGKIVFDTRPERNGGETPADNIPFRLSLDSTAYGGSADDGVAYFTGTRDGVKNYHTGLFISTNVGAVLPLESNPEARVHWDGMVGYVPRFNNNSFNVNGTFRLKLNLNATTFTIDRVELESSTDVLEFSGGWNEFGVITGISSLNTAITGTVTGVIGTEGAVGAFWGDNGTSGYAGGFVASGDVSVTITEVPTPTSGKVDYSYWAYEIQTRDGAIPERVGGTGYLQGLSKSGTLGVKTLNGGTLRTNGGASLTTPYRLALADANDGVAYFSGILGGMVNYHAGLFDSTDVGNTLTGARIAYWNGELGINLGNNGGAIHRKGSFTLKVNMSSRTFRGLELAANIADISFTGGWHAQTGVITNGVISRTTNGATISGTLTGLIGEAGAVAAFRSVNSGTDQWVGGFVATASVLGTHQAYDSYYNYYSTRGGNTQLHTTTTAGGVTGFVTGTADALLDDRVGYNRDKGASCTVAAPCFEPFVVKANGVASSTNGFIMTHGTHTNYFDRYRVGILPTTDLGVNPNAGMATWNGNFYISSKLGEDGNPVATPFVLNVNFSAGTLTAEKTFSAIGTATKFEIAGVFGNNVAATRDGFARGLPGGFGGNVLFRNNNNAFVAGAGVTGLIGAQGTIGVFINWIGSPNFVGGFEAFSSEAVLVTEVVDVVGADATYTAWVVAGNYPAGPIKTGIENNVRTGYLQGQVKRATFYHVDLANHSASGGSVADGVTYYATKLVNSPNPFSEYAYHAGLFNTTNVGAVLPTRPNLQNSIANWSGTLGRVLGYRNSSTGMRGEANQSGTFTLEVDFFRSTFIGKDFAPNIRNGAVISGGWNTQTGVITGTSGFTGLTGAPITGTLTGVIGEAGAVAAFVGQNGTNNHADAYAGGFVASAGSTTSAGSTAASSIYSAEVPPTNYVTSATLASRFLPASPLSTSSSEFAHSTSPNIVIINQGLGINPLFDHCGQGIQTCFSREYKIGGSANAFYLLRAQNSSANGVWYRAGILLGSNLGTPPTTGSAVFNGSLYVSNQIDGNGHIAPIPIRLNVDFTNSRITQIPVNLSMGGHSLALKNNVRFDSNGVLSGNVEYYRFARTVIMAMNGLIGANALLGVFHSSAFTTGPIVGGFWATDGNPLPSPVAVTGFDFGTVDDFSEDMVFGNTASTSCTVAAPCFNTTFRLGGDVNSPNGFGLFHGHHATDGNIYRAGLLLDTDLGRANSTGSANWTGNLYISNKLDGDNNPVAVPIRLGVNFATGTITTSAPVTVVAATSETIAIDGRFGAHANAPTAEGVLGGVVNYKVGAAAAIPLDLIGAIGEDGVLGVFHGTVSGANTPLVGGFEAMYIPPTGSITNSAITDNRRGAHILDSAPFNSNTVVSVTNGIPVTLSNGLTDDDLGGFYSFVSRNTTASFTQNVAYYTGLLDGVAEKVGDVLPATFSDSTTFATWSGTFVMYYGSGRGFQYTNAGSFSHQDFDLAVNLSAKSFRATQFMYGGSIVTLDGNWDNQGAITNGAMFTRGVPGTIQGFIGVRGIVGVVASNNPDANISYAGGFIAKP